MNTVTVDSRPMTPSKIVCVGRNYLEHIQELGNETPDSMVIFAKPNSSISARLRANIGEPLHYEGEISFVVKDARLHAVGFGLDLTRRELQSQLKNKGLPWERAKAFDGAACFSEFVLIDDADIESLTMALTINGRDAQQGGYPLMIYKPQQILQEISNFMTLNDGDIIMTGTPKGVGTVTLGDHFLGSISLSGRILLSQEWTAS
ncbi:MAG: fumarylacetoacetate hydrolase family protein [Proteobacteria bacterium]|nr:fumarylacetoacetate hydrolase family protein [Pseudomonadota bacterium]